MANPKNVKRERARQMNRGGQSGTLETKFSSVAGKREIAELEDLIDRLERDYTLFFNGISNIDPSDRRARANKIISRLHELHIRNPSIKFRFQSLMGRYVSLKNNWDRILKEIERGTYKRDIFRAQIKQRQAEDFESVYTKKKRGLYSGNVPEQSEAPPTWNTDTDNTAPVSGAASDQRTAQTWKKPAAKPIAPMCAPDRSNGAASKADNGSIDRLYSDFSSARQQANLPPVSRQALERTVEQQKERLKQKYNAADVEFKVETKEGKVVLKPVAVKKK